MNKEQLATKCAEITAGAGLVGANLGGRLRGGGDGKMVG